MELRIKNLQRETTEAHSRWLCSQFSVEKLHNILGLSLSTIHALRRGQTTLRKAERRLLQLTIERRIMPDKWPGNITFEPDDTIHLSRYSISWGQLEHYSWISERWGESLRTSRALSDYLDDVIEMLTEVQRVKAMRLRTAMIESVTTGQPYELVARNRG